MPSISVPVWQNGTPQSMQRAPCWAQRGLVGVFVELIPVMNAFAGGAASGNSRGNSINPVGFPMSTTS